jgi:1-acyl-sn-glycerol-3-phosphate acyltransferase
MYTHLQPRPLTGFAKSEAWHNPFLAFLFDHWDIIPLRRGEADIAAFQEGLRALDADKMLVLSPEGTRSGHGRLQRAHAGVVLLALRREEVPILPIVFYGNERLMKNLKRLRRTDFHVVVGDPFFVDPGDGRVTRTTRRRIVDEIMYQMAALLPSAYRGYYADLAHATTQYLRFPPGSRSSLEHASV